jgi:hypothetical protein
MTPCIVRSVDYLTMLSETRVCVEANDWMVNNELEEMWKEELSVSQTA